MERRRRVVLVFLLLTLSACREGGTDPDSDPSPWSGQVLVSGTIRDFRTNAVVPEASITIGSHIVTTGVDGSYSVQVAQGVYSSLTVNGELILGQTSLNIPNYRGDFYINTAGCVGRYGTVADVREHKPVSSATVTAGGAGRATTDREGWYNIGAGCDSRCVGFNTITMTVTHPDYLDASGGGGRGICDVQRVDFQMTHR